MSSPASSSVRLVGDRELVTTRAIDAPRELVFRAYTDPEAIPHWWGPARYTTTVVEMDVRPGGKWRHVQHDADGNEFGFSGEYRDVVPAERLVSTFEWDGAPGHVSVDTLTLEERDGKTFLTSHTLFTTPEERDEMTGTGMEEGMMESWDRLEAYVSTARKEQ